MGDTIEYFIFLRDRSDPQKDAAAGLISARVPQWKLVEFEKTPAGCPIPKEGKIWDPIIGAGPFCPYMVPKGVAVNDGVIAMMHLYYKLPFEIHGITKDWLRNIHRFVKKTTNNGHTVYDADGNLMTIDGRVMRGNKLSDEVRLPGLVNETNFITQPGMNKQLWFNRLFNGADTELPGMGADFAQNWLTKYTSHIKDNWYLEMNIYRPDRAKQGLYEKYYLTELARREKPLASTLVPKLELAPKIKIRVKLVKLVKPVKLETARKPGSKPLKRPADLVEPNKENDGDKSDRKMSLGYKPLNLKPFPKVPTVVKKLGTTTPEEFNKEDDSEKSEQMMPLSSKPLFPKLPTVVKKSNKENDNEGSKEEVVSALTKTTAEPATEKSAETLQNPAPTSPSNITPAPVETATETAAKWRREIAAATKALEHMKRMAAEAEEKAAVEKVAVERAAAKEAAAKLAKANAESNRALKCMGEDIKNTVSAYLAQRKAETADKILVGQVDDELAPYFREALDVAASEPQKRKSKEEEIGDQRPVKFAKK